MDQTLNRSETQHTTGKRPQTLPPTSGILRRNSIAVLQVGSIERSAVRGRIGSWPLCIIFLEINVT